MVRFQLHIGDHLVLHTRFVLILLSTRSCLNLLFNLLVFQDSDTFLVRHCCLNGVFYSLDVLQSCDSLHFVHSDSLLKKQLHFSPHFLFAFCLRLEDSFLLESHSLLLLGNLRGFCFDLVQNLLLFLKVSLVVHHFFSDLDLKLNEMVWVSHKLLVSCPFI